MAVRANKPAFNIREKLKELTHSVGLKGRELMRAATVQEARDLVSAGRKNMVINGDMRVFQRNNSGNASNVGTYFLDRFQVRNNTAGTLYVTQQSSSSGGPPGFRSWLLAQCDGADTSVDSGDYARIQHYIEGYNCFMDWGYGNTDYVTASFWVKSNKPGTYCFQIEDGDASPLYSQEYVIEQSDVWQKVVLIIPPPITGTWRGGDSGIGARLTWTLMAGSSHPTTANVWQTGYGMRTDNQVNFMDDDNNNFYLTGVQLEVGRNATDFEYRSYGEELALCQRYYLRLNSKGNNHPIANVYGEAGSQVYGTFHFPVQMRDAPTFTYSATNHFTVIHAGTVTAGPTMFNSTLLTAGIGANTAGSGTLAATGASQLRFTTTAGWIAFAAEL